MSSESIGAIEFEFIAKNIKNLKTTDSNIVYVRGLSWFIRIQKVIQEKQVPSLGVHLISNHKENDQNWAIIACATVELLSSTVNRASHKVFLERCKFSPNKSTIGNDFFISYTDLFHPMNGFVCNDTCSFKVKIKADRLQNANLTMEFKQKYYGINGKFCFKINEIDHMFGVFSSEFTLAKIPWQISMVKRDDKNQFDDRSAPITAFLQIQLYNNDFADNKKDWSCRATLKCRLIPCHPTIRARQSIIENVKFDRKTSYGSLSLISWNELIDPSKKFIKNESGSIEWELIIEDVKGFTEDDTFTNVIKPMKCEAIEMECSICFENLINRTVYSTLCGHMFHRICLLAAIKQKKECPECRKAYKGAIKIYLPDLRTD